MFSWLTRLRRERDWSQATEAGVRKRAILFFSVAAVVLTIMAVTLWLEREQCALADAVSCFFSNEDIQPDSGSRPSDAPAVQASP